MTETTQGCWANTTTAVRYCNACGERVRRYWLVVTYGAGGPFYKRLCERCKEKEDAHVQ